MFSFLLFLLSLQCSKDTYSRFVLTTPKAANLGVLNKLP